MCCHKKENFRTGKRSRTFFRKLIGEHAILDGTQIDAKHNIVHTPHFDNGIVKILNSNEANLTAAEKTACKMFLVQAAPAAPAAGPAVLAAAGGKIDFMALLKKRKMETEQKGSAYINLSFIPTGSVDVETSFSSAKYIATDQRSRLLPVTLETLMFLKHNRRFWSVAQVHEALQLADNILYDDEDDE